MSRHDLVGSAGVAGIKQQRRGTYVPRKNSVIENLNKAMMSSMENDDGAADMDMKELQPWLEKVQRKGTFAVRKGKILHEIPVTEAFNGIYNARYSPDGSYIATAFGAGAIQTWKADTGELIGTIRGGMEHAYPIMCIRFHHNQSDLFFASGSCGNIYMCRNIPGHYSKIIEESDNEINSIDLNQDSSLLVSVGKDAVVRIYDTEKAKLMTAMPDPKVLLQEDDDSFHRMRVFAVKFHPYDRNVFLTGGWDDVVKVWDLRMKSGCTRNIKGPHVCGDAIDMREREVLTGSWVVKESIQIWDMGSGKLIDTVVPTNRPQSIDGEFLYCVQYFSGDNAGDTIISGGSGTGLVEVISIIQKKIISYFKVHKTIQAIDSYDCNIVFGGMESTLRVAEFTGFFSYRYSLLARAYSTLKLSTTEPPHWSRGEYSTVSRRGIHHIILGALQHSRTADKDRVARVWRSIDRIRAGKP